MLTEPAGRMLGCDNMTQRPDLADPRGVSPRVHPGTGAVGVQFNL